MKYCLDERLKEFINEKGKRDASKKSQSEVASSLGITRQAVASYLSGRTKPDAVVLYSLSEYLGVSADYLLGLSDSPSLEYDYQNAFRFTGLKQEALASLNKMMNIEKQQIDELGINIEEYYQGKIGPVVYDIVSAIIANEHFIEMVTYLGQASIYPEDKSRLIPHITDDGNYVYGGIVGREFLKYKALSEFQSLMDEVVSVSKTQGAE